MNASTPRKMNHTLVAPGHLGCPDLIWCPPSRAGRPPLSFDRHTTAVGATVCWMAEWGASLPTSCLLPSCSARTYVAYAPWSVASTCPRAARVSRRSCTSERRAHAEGLRHTSSLEIWDLLAQGAGEVLGDLFDGERFVRVGHAHLGNPRLPGWARSNGLGAGLKKLHLHSLLTALPQGDG
jgi:hypothetical protein